MSYSLHSEAEMELASAASFYQAQAGNALAQAFLSEFDRVASLLDHHPGIGRPARGDLRIHPFRRFPYSVVYRARPEGISILVVGHHHRRPEYWRERR